MSHGEFARTDPLPEIKRALVKDLVKVARASDIRVTVCAQPEFLAAGAAPARCIDAGRLSDIKKQATRVPTMGFRPGCLCAKATDIGDYAAVAGGLYCGTVSKERTWPVPGPQDETLFPTKRFARPCGEDLPF
jgi:hypothetical protein